MATRAGEENTRIPKRAYLAPKTSKNRGSFQIKKLQAKDGEEYDYYVAFDGVLVGVDMVLTESKEYGPSVSYIINMEESQLGRVDIYVAAASGRCCELINQLLSLDTSKPCELKVFAYPNYVGLAIGFIGQTSISRKFAKIETEKGSTDKTRYEGVPDLEKKATKMNAKGEQEYEYDNDNRVKFFLAELCKAYPAMFDGEMFEPQIVRTDPRSPYSQIILQANSNSLNSQFQPPSQTAVEKSEVLVWLESKKQGLSDKLHDLIVNHTENNEIQPAITETLRTQVASLIKLKGKTDKDKEDVINFYANLFHEWLYKKLPAYAFHPKTFNFQPDGLVIFNQPTINSNKQADDDDLPF